MARWRDKIRQMFHRPPVYNCDEPEEEESEEPEEETVTCSKGLFFCCLNCCTCEGCSCSVDVGFKGSMV
jgi:hypothetical protein